MIKEELLKILRAIEDLEDVDFDSEKKLVTNGILDSYSILVLVTQIERKFQVRLSIDGPLGNHFDSIEKMENMIHNSRKASAG